MRNVLLLVTIFVGFAAQSQVTYADNVAAILFDKCTSCHHNGGIAPFSLMTYTEANAYSGMIQLNVNNGNMPPWPPDNTYSEFAHDLSLSASEIQAINDWVNGGAPEGNPANTPAAPVYNIGSVLGAPDLQIKAPVYQSKATSSNDDYVCFVIPTGLATNRTIQAIEVLPGDPSIVHHVLVHYDPTGSYNTDTSSHICAGPAGTTEPLIAGYAPGSMPTVYPDDPSIKMGVDLPANSNIVLAMHYPNGSQGKWDSTKVNFHFYPQGTSGVRQVTSSPVLYDAGFTIQANTIDSVEAYFPNASTPVPSNFTLFSIFPHAHLIGTSFIVYAENHFVPSQRIPLIHIPQWDFEWQGFYVFKYLQKLPVGYKLYGKAVYDNTASNPFNPNTPPQNISFGLNTTDEMFIVYLQYMTYQNGDENINIDSLVNLQVGTSVQPQPLAVNEEGVFFTVYPNPMQDVTQLHIFLENMSDVRLQISDLQGREVYSNALKDQQGEFIINWDGKDLSAKDLPSGTYIVTLQVGEKQISRKLIKQ